MHTAVKFDMIIMAKVIVIAIVKVIVIAIVIPKAHSRPVGHACVCIEYSHVQEARERDRVW